MKYRIHEWQRILMCKQGGFRASCGAFSRCKKPHDGLNRMTNIIFDISPKITA
jgi:hypothetical protein